MNRPQSTGTAWLLAASLAVSVAACDSSSDGGDAREGDLATAQDAGRDSNVNPDIGDDLAAADVPYVVPNPGGKAHGEACTADADCWFRRCIAAPSLTGGAFRICTKDCGSGPNSSCSLEDQVSGDYTCVRFSSSSDDDLPAFCMPTCASAATCPAGYDDCRIVVGTMKTCAVKP